MNERDYLRQQIKACRRKLNRAKLLDSLVLFAAAFGVGGILCEGISIFVPFYYAHAVTAACFGAGVLAGSIYAVCKRVSMRQAAGKLDSFGLKERMITALELMDKEHAFAQLQRQDAVSHYNAIREQIRIPLRPDVRHLAALGLSVVVALTLGLVPSVAKEQAVLQHQVQKAAKEEEETLEELMDALEGVDMESLTMEQQAELQELMDALELSREELAEADSWDSLNTAKGKLDYKYEQTANSLENLAELLDNPEAAGVADAKAFASAAANESGQQMAASGTASGTAGSGSGSEDGTGEGDGNGSADGSDSGDGDGSGNGDGSGSGDGNGSGNGDGSGDGDGSGSGDGDSSGNGGGRGTGSSNTAHDYVSIPNPVGDDASLTGDKDGDTDSDYYRQNNGLAWEGDHVDYNSVIGDYTDSAYEGIANGKYPSGMESVIKNYFESLN